MTKRFNKHKASNPMEVAYLSMADRVNRMVAVLTDPYQRLSEETKVAIVEAIQAIEQEWLIPGVNCSPDFGD